MKKVLWTVGLSNGETLAEEKGNFKTIEGALSPWQRLLSYCADKGLEITSLSLYTNDGRRWNLPSAGKNPRFREFNDLEKPIDFIFQRKVAQERRSGAMDVEGEWQELHTIVIAVYPEGRQLQVWVAEDTLASWSVII